MKKAEFEKMNITVTLEVLNGLEQNGLIHISRSINHGFAVNRIPYSTALDQVPSEFAITPAQYQALVQKRQKKGNS